MQSVEMGRSENPARRQGALIFALDAKPSEYLKAGGLTVPLKDPIHWAEARWRAAEPATLARGGA